MDTPHPVIVTIRDNTACIRVLFTTITGWGGPPKRFAGFWWVSKRLVVHLKGLCT